MSSPKFYTSPFIPVNPRNYDEAVHSHVTEQYGALGGAALGMAAAGGLYAKQRRSQKDMKLRDVAGLGAAVIFPTAVGSVIGHAIGNHRILKDRQASGDPVINSDDISKGHQAVRIDASQDGLFRKVLFGV